MVDSLLDVMNSISPFPPNSRSTRAAFGILDYYEAKKKLEDMKNEILNMSKGEHVYVAFPKGYNGINQLFNWID